MNLLPYLPLTLLLTLAPRAQDATDFKDLEKRWQDMMQELRVPGMAVVVVRGDKTLLRRTYGTRDGKRPVTERSAFYIASATKPFVALALMQQVDAGKLDLDAPVKKYLKRFRLADAAATNSVTVRELLNHAAGINSGPIVTLDAFTGEITEDRYYRFLREVQPSGTVLYSNVHFTLAGRVLEAVSGKPWRDYLAQHVFEPAGMRDTTGYADAMYARDDVALPMLPGAEEPTPCQRKTDRTMHAAGGLGASIRDLERWLRIQLDGGVVEGKRVVSEKSLAEMHAQQSKLAKPRGRLRVQEGFGLSWSQGTYRGRPYRQHGGGFTGAAAHVSFLPDDGIGVAAVANTSGTGHALIELVSIDVYDRLLGDKDRDYMPGFVRQAKAYMAKLENARSSAKNLAASGELSQQVAAYAGSFAHTDWGRIVVEVRDGTLVARMGDLEAELLEAGRDKFTAFTPPDTKAAGHFEIDSAGAVLALHVVMGGAKSVRFERK